MPSVADLVRREAGDLLVLEADAAAIDRVDGGDEVEDRRLPGAVRADEPDDLFLVHGEVQIGDDLQAAEVLVDPGEGEKRRPGRHYTLPTEQPLRTLPPAGGSDAATEPVKATYPKQRTMSPPVALDSSG